MHYSRSPQECPWTHQSQSNGLVFWCAQQRLKHHIIDVPRKTWLICFVSSAQRWQAETQCMHSLSRLEIVDQHNSNGDKGVLCPAACLRVESGACEQARAKHVTSYYTVQWMDYWLLAGPGDGNGARRCSTVWCSAACHAFPSLIHPCLQPPMPRAESASCYLLAASEQAAAAASPARTCTPIAPTGGRLTEAGGGSCLPPPPTRHETAALQCSPGSPAGGAEGRRNRDRWEQHKTHAPREEKYYITRQSPHYTTLHYTTISLEVRLHYSPD
jgi:hypothetical protein